MATLSPSILTADFADLAQNVHALVARGCAHLHVDVMDGNFVNNISFGPCVLSALHARFPALFFDTHLMVSQPQKWVAPFAAAGSSRFTAHFEALETPEAVAALRAQVKAARMDFGLALNPETDCRVLWPILERCPLDCVLIMSVTPGFGGQRLDERALAKVRALRAAFPQLEIVIDGGVNLGNVADCVAAGVSVVVAGSAVFSQNASLETVGARYAALAQKICPAN